MGTRAVKLSFACKSQPFFLRSYLSWSQRNQKRNHFGGSWASRGGGHKPNRQTIVPSSGRAFGVLKQEAMLVELGVFCQWGLPVVRAIVDGVYIMSIETTRSSCRSDFCCSSRKNKENW